MNKPCLTEGQIKEAAKLVVTSHKGEQTARSTNVAGQYARDMPGSEPMCDLSHSRL